MKKGAAALCVALLAAGLVFFYECVLFLARRDYVAGILAMFVGFAVMRGGSEMARLALKPRRS